MGIFGFKNSRHLTREIGITPPVPQKDRNGIAIMSCVKNEVLYISEWVRFHQAIGVRHFILYDDQSTDGTLSLLKTILSQAELTVVPWSMRMIDMSSGQPLNGQALAYAHAILNYGSAFERMAFIDVDEFILPKSGATLQEALVASKGFPNISLPWHMFGHNGHDVKSELPVSEAYTMRVSDPMKRHEHANNFKCIVDPAEITHVSVHHFSTRSFGDTTSNDAGQIFTRSGRKDPEFYSNQHLQLNHYYSKSREELRQKIARGWSYNRDSGKYRDKTEATADYIEKNAIEDKSMIEFLKKTGLDLR